MKMLNVLAFLLTLTFISAHTVSASDRDLHAFVDGNNKGIAKALLAGDIDEIMKAYSSEGAVIPPQSDPIKGTESIKSFWTAVAASGVTDVQISTDKVGSSGDLAYALGTLVVTGANGEVSNNNYTLVFKKVGGDWKVIVDTWTPGKS